MIATIDVLEGQLERYADLARDVEGLAQASKPDTWADDQGKLQWAGEELTLGFGKHRGKSLQALVKRERNYLEWILSSDFPADTKAILREALAGRFPDPKR